MHRRHVLLACAVLVLAACSDSSTSPRAAGFLGGTADDPQIGLVVNSTGKALTLFQLGDPAQQRQVAFGSSTLITPTSFATRGHAAVVPLGNAASVALVDLDAMSVTRTFLLASGNATGAAFFDDTTVFVANYTGNYVGRFTLRQGSETILDTVSVTPTPGTIVPVGDRVLVLSQNLNTAGDYSPLGNSVVTAIDARTLAVLGSVESDGTNAQDAALGPDGKLYVLNTGPCCSTASSLSIIDPVTLQVETTIPGMGTYAGSLDIDENGLAYISGFFFGTLVWDTRTRQFVRGPDEPVCAPLPTGDCRGAFSAAAASNGDLYQVFFGSAADDLAPYVFVYRAGSFALADSIPVGVGPGAIQIRTF